MKSTRAWRSTNVRSISRLPCWAAIIRAVRPFSLVDSTEAPESINFRTTSQSDFNAATMTAFGPQMTGLFTVGSAPKQLSMICVRRAVTIGNISGSAGIGDAVLCGDWAMVGAAISVAAVVVAAGMVATAATVACANFVIGWS